MLDSLKQDKKGPLGALFFASVSRPEISCHYRDLFYKTDNPTHPKRTQRDYTLTFKLAVVTQVEKGELTCQQARAHYGIQGKSTVLTWLRKHGTLNWSAPRGSTMPKTPETSEQKIKCLEKKLKDMEVLHYTQGEMLKEVDRQCGTDFEKSICPLCQTGSSTGKSKSCSSLPFVWSYSPSGFPEAGPGQTSPAGTGASSGNGEGGSAPAEGTWDAENLPFDQTRAGKAVDQTRPRWPVYTALRAKATHQACEELHRNDTQQALDAKVSQPVS